MNKILRQAIANLSFVLFIIMLGGNALAQDRVGVVPFKVFGPFEVQYLKDAIPEMLYSRLTFTNKEIIKKEQLKDVLKDVDAKDELALAQQFLARTDFSCLIMGSYTKMGEAFSLDVKVLKRGEKEFKTFFVALDKESKIFDAVSSVAEKIGGYVTGGVSVVQPLTPSSSSKDTKGLKRVKILEVKSPIYGIALAEGTVAGKKQIVTAASSSINVYNWNGEKLDLFQTIDLKGQEILYLNAGDFNKNGKTEIYVTAIDLEEVLTTVFEAGNDGKLNSIAKGDWYVKVINHPELGDILVGQRMGPNEAFSGEIYQLDLKSSVMVAKSKIDAVRNMNIYQITPLKYRNNKAFGYFDEGDYLKILDVKGKVLERLKERYDGSVLGIVKGFDDMTRDKKFTPLNSRVVRIADGDTDALLTIKNEGSRLFLRSKKFDRGSLTFLKFDEVNYKEAASTEVMDGYVSDFTVDFADRLIYASVVTDTKEGRIFIFTFPN
ncbi:MAG: hypothetical protein OHK0040_13720 [bacterium]